MLSKDLGILALVFFYNDPNLLNNKIIFKTIIF